MTHSKTGRQGEPDPFMAEGIEPAKVSAAVKISPTWEAGQGEDLLHGVSLEAAEILSGHISAEILRARAEDPSAQISIEVPAGASLFELVPTATGHAVEFRPERITVKVGPGNRKREKCECGRLAVVQGQAMHAWWCADR